MYRVEGALSKVYEGSGEGVAVFSALGANVTLGSGGLASKSFYFKIPLAKPRGCRVSSGILTIGITAPPTVKTPFRWRLELDGLTISREAKPQFSTRLEDSTFYKVAFDVRPILAAKGELAVDSYTLRALYDSAHPIVVREVSLFKVNSKPRLEHSAVYLTGALAIEPGESHTVTLRTPRSLEGGSRVLVLTLIIPSPRITLNIRSGSEQLEVSGHGFKIVELQPESEGEARVAIDYPKPEISIYPKRVLLTNVVLIENKIPTPPLRVQTEEVTIERGLLRVKLLISNEGDEAAEDIQVALKHAMVNLKDVRIAQLEPGDATSIILETDTSRIPATARKLTVKVTWSKDGIASSKNIDLELPSSS